MASRSVGGGFDKARPIRHAEPMHAIDPPAPAIERTLSLLADLVAFDTTSARSNIPLIAYIEAYLGAHGVASQRVMSACGDKANLFASLGPATGGGIALSGHTDVVPADPAAWSYDPFRLTRVGNRVYGRGTTDMKGFVAATLAMVPEFAARPLAKPLHLAFTYDEEVGCLGVRPLIAAMGERLPRPDIVLVGEPSRMQVVDAHKAVSGYETVITGRAGHSSMPHLGVNAIFAAADIIQALRGFERELAVGHRDPRFDPDRTTIHVGEIAGGLKLNIIPAEARVSWQIRALPGLDAGFVPGRLAAFAEETLLPGMRAIAPEAAIVTRALSAIPALAAPAGSKAVSLALALAARNETFAVSYGTEAGLYQAGGSDAVIIGPGDIAQAHTVDEFVEVSELVACLAFLERLANQLCA